MPDQSSDARIEPASEEQPLSRAHRRWRGRETEVADAAPEATPIGEAVTADWRLGGPTVRSWREWLFAGALISLGVGVLVATLLDWAWDSPWATPSATAVLWLGMLVPVVWAFTRSRPIRLLRFGILDLLYGIVLGVMLRLAQGWMEAAGGAAAFPVAPTTDGTITTTWWLVEALPAVTVAPVVEELFFRAVVLVSLYTLFRRALGTVVAGLISAVVSTALFIGFHALTVELSVDGVIATGLLGLVCAALVLLTGRIWGAVLVHAVYNATYVALAVLGTF